MADCQMKPLVRNRSRSLAGQDDPRSATQARRDGDSQVSHSGAHRLLSRNCRVGLWRTSGQGQGGRISVRGRIRAGFQTTGSGLQPGKKSLLLLRSISFFRRNLTKPLPIADNSFEDVRGGR
jgi:hypothetical protein